VHGTVLFGGAVVVAGYLICLLHALPECYCILCSNENCADRLCL